MWFLSLHLKEFLLLGGGAAALHDLLVKSELYFQRLNIWIVDSSCLVRHANSSLMQKILMHAYLFTCAVFCSSYSASSLTVYPATWGWRCAGLISPTPTSASPWEPCSQHSHWPHQGLLHWVDAAEHSVWRATSFISPPTTDVLE